MGGKKSKALALDLIDELLQDDAGSIEIVKDADAANNSESDHTEKNPVERDHTVDLGKTEVSDPDMSATHRGDEGGRSVLARQKDRVRQVPLPGTMATLDLDTPEDWAAFHGRQTPSA